MHFGKQNDSVRWQKWPGYCQTVLQPENYSTISWTSMWNFQNSISKCGSCLNLGSKGGSINQKCTRQTLNLFKFQPKSRWQIEAPTVSPYRLKVVQERAHQERRWDFVGCKTLCAPTPNTTYYHSQLENRETHTGRLAEPHSFIVRVIGEYSKLLLVVLWGHFFNQPFRNVTLVILLITGSENEGNNLQTGHFDPLVSTLHFTSTFNTHRSWQSYVLYMAAFCCCTVCQHWQSPFSPTKEHRW